MEINELITVIVTMLKDFFAYLTPVFGIVAGFHVILNMLYKTLFKPFKSND